MKPLTRWSAVLSLALIAGFAASCAKKAKEAPPTPPPAPAQAETPPTPPAPPPTQPPPSPAPEPTKVEFEPAFFDFDSYKLRDDARSVLGHDARVLRENSDVHVTIEGHCDERGTHEYNLALGERRAQAVKNVLAALGIPASRISTISYGKERPEIPHSDDTSYAQNRRGVTTVN